MELFYFVVGVLVALALLVTQLWTVNQMTPDRSAKAQRLWSCGLGLRWLSLTLLLISTFWQGTFPALLAFSGIVAGRWLGLSWLHQSEFKWVKG